MILCTISNPSVCYHSKIWSKKPQICISIIDGEKGQNPYLMEDQDEEIVYKTNFKIFKTLSPVMMSLMQAGSKSLNLYIMYQQWQKDRNQ